jgi:hypothetical protein
LLSSSAAVVLLLVVVAAVVVVVVSVAVAVAVAQQQLRYKDTRKTGRKWYLGATIFLHNGGTVCSDGTDLKYLTSAELSSAKLHE